MGAIRIADRMVHARCRLPNLCFPHAPRSWLRLLGGMIFHSLSALSDLHNLRVFASARPARTGFIPKPIGRGVRRLQTCVPPRGAGPPQVPEAPSRPDAEHPERVKRLR